MPELAEIECLRRRIGDLVIGRRLSGVTVVRNTYTLRGVTSATFARLPGNILDAIERRGKLLIFRMSDKSALLLHCGMSGRLVPRRHGNKHDLFSISFQGGVHLTYNDFRRFGRIWRVPQDDLDLHPVLGELGPEPLSDQFNEATLNTNSKRSVKATLLDQSMVAGLGNIYVCESLYRAQINPKRELRTLTRTDRTRLVRAIKNTLDAAIAHGGSTLNDYRGTEGEAGNYESQFAVFGREGLPCPKCKCGSGVGRIVQNGRSTFLCEALQK